MYRLHFREDLGYLEAELAGFWTLDELYGFNREMQGMVKRYAPQFPSFPLLSDSRNHGVQSTK
jgi:hypothetical protein